LAEVLGYKKLERGPGFRGAGVMGDRLASLMYWCMQNNLPALTSLVVREDTSMPGLGISLDPAEVLPEQQKVYAFHWYEIFAPTVAQLEKAQSKGRREAA
jgi:hypothetical protein